MGNWYWSIFSRKTTKNKKTYIIDEERKTIIAKYESVPDATDEIYHRTKVRTRLNRYQNQSIIDKLLNDVVERANQKNTKFDNVGAIELFCQEFDPLYGKATVDEYDEFDINKGKQLAGLKLDRKWHDRMGRDYWKLAKVCHRLTKEFISLTRDHEKKVSNIDKDLERIYLQEEDKC